MGETFYQILSQYSCILYPYLRKASLFKILKNILRSWKVRKKQIIKLFSLFKCIRIGNKIVGNWEIVHT